MEQSVSVSPTASVKPLKQASLDLHTSFQPNLIKGLKGPNWEGHEHANRTKIHAREQRLEQ